MKWKAMFCLAMFFQFLFIQFACPWQMAAAKPPVSATTVSSSNSVSKTSGFNLNLTSTQATISAANLSLSQSLIIYAGGIAQRVNATSMLTPAQFVAAYQVATQGVQTLKLSALGAASGGRFVINPALAPKISQLVIPQGVKVFDNVSATGSLNLTGDLVNGGKFVAISSNPLFSTASISADNIYNLSTGVITSVVPVLPSNVNSRLTDLNLSLTALGDIVNSGQIISAGLLSLTAAGSVSNIAKSGSAPLLQAVSDVTLSSVSGNIVNSGTILSSAGSINISAGNAANNLVVNNTGGTMTAWRNINVGTAGSITNAAGQSNSPGSLSVAGGNLIANELNFTCPGGNISVQTNEISGNVNVSGGNAVVGTQEGGLSVTSMNLTGDPIIYSQGNGAVLNLNGFSNLFKTNGADFIVLSGGDIDYTGASATVNAMSATGSGGAITLAAGVTFTTAGGASPISCTTCSYTITGTSDAGGSVNAGPLSLSTSGNTIQVQANAGTVSSGAVTIGNIITSGVNGAKGTVASPSGQAGGAGGNISVTGAGNIVAGTVSAVGGTGGKGYTGGAGGGGGASGNLSIVSSTGTVNVAGILLQGGNAGQPGTNGGPSAGGAGGNVTISGTTIAGSTISSTGGLSGGFGTGGSGGEIELTGSTKLSFSNVSSVGGGGFNGGNAQTLSFNAPTISLGNVTGNGGNGAIYISGSGGAGGNTNDLDITGTTVTVGAVLIQGGAGGNATSTGSGGQGGSAGNIAITGITTGTTVVNQGGSGGSGGIGAGGGQGGDAGGITITGGATTATKILSQGGNGGAGGSASGAGGSAGNSGAIDISGTTIAATSVSSLGGKGGGATTGSAGSGGNSDTVSLTLGSISGLSVVSLGGSGSIAGLSAAVDLTSSSANIGSVAVPVSVSTDDLQVTAATDAYIQGVGNINFSANSTAAGNFVITGNGNITSASGVSIQAALVSATTSGNIGANAGTRFTANSTNLVINASNAYVHAIGAATISGNSIVSGTFNLLSDNNMNTDSGVSVKANSLLLTSTTGGIGTSAAFTINAEDLSASASFSGQSVNINSPNGGVNFLSSSGANATFILSANGTITSSVGSSINANLLQLTAVTGSIGASVNAPVFTAASQLEATVEASGQNVFINNTGSLNINSVSGANTISIVSSGSISMASGAVLNATNITLNAQGGTFNLQGNIAATTSLSFLCQGNITDAAIGTYFAPLLTYGSSAGSIGAVGTALDLNSITDITANAMAPEQVIVISDNAFLTFLGNSAAGATLNVTSSQYINAAVGVQLSAPNIILQANGGDIGNSSPNGVLAIQANNLTANASAGSVYIHAIGSINVAGASLAENNFILTADTNLTSSSGATISAAQLSLIATAGSFNLTATISSTNSATLQSAGSITNANTGTSVFFNPTSLTLTSTTGSIGNGTAEGQEFNTQSTSIVANAPNGFFNISSPGSITVAGNSNAMTSARFYSDGYITVENKLSSEDITLQTNGVSFSGSGLIQATVSATLESYGPGVEFQLTAPATINVTAGNLTISGGTVVVTGAGALAINALSANLSATTSLTVNSNLTVSNTGNLTVSAPTFNFDSQAKLSVSQSASTMNIYATTVNLNGAVTLAGAGGLIQMSGTGNSITFFSGNPPLNIVGSPLLLQSGANGEVYLNAVMINSTNNVTISADTDIVAYDQITAGNLVLTTQTNDVGESDFPILTQAKTVTVNAGGNAYVSQTSGNLTLNSSFAGADFDLTSANALSVNSVTANGNITLTTNSGQLNVLAGAVLSTGDGNIVLNAASTGNGSIAIGKGAEIYGVNSAVGGNVTIAVGTLPPPMVAGNKPANVSVSTSNGGAIYFGTNSISGLNPVNTITADKNDVIFSTGALPASAIQLAGGVNIVASDVVALNSLDLTNSAVTGLIVIAQNDGEFGGKLIVSGGVATGGTVILQPADFFPILSAINIPANVTVTMSGFGAANPIEVVLNGSSTTDQVLIGGTLNFQGNQAYGTLNISTNQSAAPLMVATTGSIASGGRLIINANGNLVVSGPLSAPNITLDTNGNSNDNLNLASVIGRAGSNTQITINLNNSGSLMPSASASLVASTISIFSQNGSIGLSTTPLNVTANNLSVASGGSGSVFIAATSSNNTLNLGTCLAGNGFSLTALSNNIMVNGMLNGGTGNVSLEVQGNSSIQSSGNLISGAAVNLIAQKGNIGSQQQNLMLSTQAIDANTSGSVYVANDRSATLGASSASLFQLTNGGNLTIDGAISAANLNIQTFSSSNGSIEVDANVGSISGTTSLNADGSITSPSGNVVGGGQLNLTANSGSIGSATQALPTASGQLTISAAHGSAYVDNTGALTVSGKVESTAQIQTSGALTAGNLSGSVIALTSGASQALQLKGNIGQAGASITVNTSAANITQKAGTAISGSSLTLNNTSGNLGSAQAVLNTGVSSLTASGSNAGSIYVNNSGALSVADVAAGGNIQITSTGALTVTDVSSANGGVTLVSQSGELMVAPSGQVSAGNGNTTLQSTNTSNGSIVVGNNASVTATGSSSLLGNVSIFISKAQAANVPGTKPAYVDEVTMDGGEVYYGKNGIAALPTFNLVFAIGNNIVFSTGALPGSAIELDGATHITATQATAFENTAGAGGFDRQGSVVDTGDCLVDEVVSPEEVVSRF